MYVHRAQNGINRKTRKPNHQTIETISEIHEIEENEQEKGIEDSGENAGGERERAREQVGGREKKDESKKERKTEKI